MDLILGSPDSLEHYFSDGLLVAYLVSGDTDTICLNFFSTAKEEWRNGRVIVRRTIKKARYWNPEQVSRTEQFKTSHNRFKQYLNTAELLKDYIYPPGQPQRPGHIRLEELIGAK